MTRRIYLAGPEVFLASALNARGIPTARGGDWHDSSVRNVLRHSEQHS